MSDPAAITDAPYVELAEIERLVARFLDCSLPCPEWTHRAHLTVGLWHAREYSPNLPYLRFPLLIEDGEARDRILDDGAGRLAGISRMYPASVGAIPQLQGRFRKESFPEAERLAASLLTLPTHPLLSAEDLRRVCAVVNGALEHVVRVSDGRPGVAVNQVSSRLRTPMTKGL